MHLKATSRLPRPLRDKARTPQPGHVAQRGRRALPADNASCRPVGKGAANPPLAPSSRSQVRGRGAAPLRLPPHPDVGSCRHRTYPNRGMSCGHPEQPWSLQRGRCIKPNPTRHPRRPHYKSPAATCVDCRRVTAVVHRGAACTPPHSTLLLLTPTPPPTGRSGRAWVGLLPSGRQGSGGGRNVPPTSIAAAAACLPRGMTPLRPCHSSLGTPAPPECRHCAGLGTLHAPCSHAPAGVLTPRPAAEQAAAACARHTTLTWNRENTH